MITSMNICSDRLDALVSLPTSNRGSVIGILKVGPKHLYIYDTNGEVYERTPLCVLDFYVHESRQRLGYGRKLFDTMLNVRLQNFLRVRVSRSV